ncbi:MAG: phosphate ABC transporter ATP-binding protein [Planctomycetes bacterium]|nr:phosphate ABC transporter ATP-binding protein [Planctomycetota bacterium]
MNQKNKIKIKADDFSFYYNGSKAIKNVSIDIEENRVTSVIGPSGCGKSTFLRCIDRMNDLIPGIKTEGKLFVDNQDVYSPDTDVVTIRRKVGMVFQKSNPFPKSIFENVAYGLRVGGVKDRDYINQKVEKSLKDTSLWEEVKDRLGENAYALSGGQQQRLCIARTLAVEPEVILMDEPASALDPLSTAKIEELIHELKKKYTIVIVTHNMQQAARIADFTALFLLGELVEYDNTSIIFTNPSKKSTQDYITGRFG